jgi:hypothetical protein
VRTQAILLLGLAAQVAAAQDPREIIRRGIEASNRNEEIAKNYTYVERDDTRVFNGDGSLKRARLRTFDVTMTEGSPYKRLTAIDDKPLTAEQERGEEEKLRQSIEERRKETPQQRSKRIAEWDKRRQKNRAFVDELLSAMDFRLLGKETVAGRPAWVIEATPHPGYHPKSTETKFLTKMNAKMWVDCQDYQAARVEAEATDDISFGVFLAKVRKGSRFVIEQAKVNDEVWMLKRAEGRISGRILFSSFAQTLDNTYKDFRKFQADSWVISTDDPR